MDAERPYGYAGTLPAEYGHLAHINHAYLEENKLTGTTARAMTVSCEHTQFGRADGRAIWCPVGQEIL